MGGQHLGPRDAQPVNGELRNISLVILFIGIITTVIVGGVVWLAHNERAIPDALIALGAGGMGSLGTLLSKTSSSLEQVQVVNPPSAPVPVEPTD